MCGNGQTFAKHPLHLPQCSKLVKKSSEMSQNVAMCPRLANSDASLSEWTSLDSSKLYLIYNEFSCISHMAISLLFPHPHIPHPLSTSSHPTSSSLILTSHIPFPHPHFPHPITTSSHPTSPFRIIRARWSVFRRVGAETFFSKATN